MSAAAPTARPFLANRIRQARREMPYENGKRISQERFAGKLNVHWTTVSAWERGTTPTLENLVAIAELTGKPLRFFTEDDEEEEADDVFRRLASELVLLGHDDMAADLLGAARRKARELEVSS